MTANVCLVSKAASRFAELEIVTASGDDNRLLFVDAPEAELQLASGLNGHQLLSWQRAV